MPDPLAFLIAYLGAGIFYTAADITSDARSKQVFQGVTGFLAAGALVCLWAPASAATIARYAQTLRSRQALAFAGTIVAPTLAIFVGALLFAASLP